MTEHLASDLGDILLRAYEIYVNSYVPHRNEWKEGHYTTSVDGACVRACEEAGYDDRLAPMFALLLKNSCNEAQDWARSDLSGAPKVQALPAGSVAAIKQALDERPNVGLPHICTCGYYDPVENPNLDEE